MHHVENSIDLHEKIRRVLMLDWDPIRINEIPEAEDEYDSYVASLYAMLISDKPVSEVFEYLVWAEAEHMGLTVDRQRTLGVAEKLVGLTDY